MAEKSIIEQSMPDIAKLRQGTYRLLSAWSLYPDALIIEITPESCGCLLAFEKTAAHLPFYIQWSKFLTFLLKVKPQDLADLQNTYMELFGESGPYKAISLYESSFLSNSEKQDCGLFLSKLLARYFDLGVQPSLKNGPDHLAVELELVSFLIGKEVVAWEQADSNKLIELLKQEKEFLGDHLVNWIPKLKRTLAFREESGFYHHLVDQISHFISHDIDFLPHLIRSLSESECGNSK